MDYGNLKVISFQDFPNICRICLSKSDTLKPFEQGLLNTFKNVTNIDITPDDNLPKNVCEGCLNRLEDICSFIILSKSSDANLNSILQKNEVNLLFQSGALESYDSDDPSSPLSDKFEIENYEKGSDKQMFIPTDDTIKIETCVILNSALEQNKKSTRHSTKGQPSSCAICGENFSTKGRLVEHQKKNSNCRIRQYKCTVCDKAFFTKFKLNMHMRSHTKETPFACKICAKKFRFAQNLKRHDDIAHKGLKPFKCDICGKEFSRLERKIQHVSLHTGECPYTCEYCGKSIKHKSTYRSHVTRHKIINGEIQDPENKCQICKKIFFSKQILTSHIEIHNGEKKFLCSICGKDFLKKCYLDVHFRIHTGEQPYECKECGKKFKQASAYQAHSLVHTGQRSFKCDVCLKTFKQSGHLRSHSKTHTGERPFKCTLCGKDFKYNSILKAHIRVHTGEMRYHCVVCDKGFYDSSTMNKHKKGHYKTEKNI